ncbi:glycerol-3-phosphate dehydrogenase/oxidase [Catellatospora sp. KI3]|uniref:glycerol-3-phosphate dehydrogenase/oxidase n=1 Tax=Catellatospora sp. KI3 TaxID=3041620 RepID=UPI002482D078|nr:glycerol-3-phosphate dehydrogenase/oxidase [Catellatospora sp. KI3]MDI1464477.1 glycerol-3-phosphate dehydrogenase/oxidase [Catellatospora sp. KI3]
MSASLTAARRTREIAALADGETVDLLVVGLGVTGAGVALDAASRGLSVAAIDAHDLAFGTSRWSSKLVHGGLRYLARGQFGVAYESAVERGILMTRTAPHLTRPLGMLLPATAGTTPGGVRLAGAGLRAGDLLRAVAGTPRAVLPPARTLSAAQVRAMVPALRADGLRGGRLGWDGQLSDDVRLVVGLARAAAAHGARILTRCRAQALTGDGATARDTVTGQELRIRARAVVNATGVWAGTLAPDITLRPSRGTHLVLPGELLRHPWTGLTIPVPGEFSRFVIVLPQPDGLVYVGLTDEPVHGPVPDVPEVPESEVEFLLGVLNPVLARPVRREEVLGAYAGLRPLMGGDGRTADISRRHAVVEGPDGVVTVVGGKLTTYRRMAQDAVDLAVRRRGLRAGRCRTRDLPLPGAADRAELARVDAPDRLVFRYGTEAPAVLAQAPPPWRGPLIEQSPVTGAELLWAVRHEGALTVDDLLDRRTRLGLVPAHRAAALAAAEQILADGLEAP